MTEDEIVQDFIKISTQETKNAIRALGSEDLIRLHFGLGMWIRNKYKLWEIEWTPVLQDGVDMSPDHPDARSMRIIEKIWESLHVKKSD